MKNGEDFMNYINTKNTKKHNIKVINRFIDRLMFILI